jgi:hypothetical protein
MKRFVVSAIWMFWLAGISTPFPVSATPQQAPPGSQSLGGILGSPEAAQKLDRIRGEGLGNIAIDPASLTQNPTIMNAGESIDNGIKGNAFSGDSGIVNVIQNSGNNVVIDSSVNLNLRFVK